MISNDLKNINIPGFTVIDKLGSGAMAKVYLSIQNALDRKVALKIMADNLLDDPEFSSRFLREAKIVAQLSHPNIVSVYDVGVFQGSHYLSMEYHPGGDLKSKIKRGIPLQEGLRIARQLSLALSFAHKEGYIHRDVKPENILFDRNNNAILTDFGIARSGDSASDMTAVGTIMGTPKYMSPEQAQGIDVDGRSDLYSLGVMMFEMLSGHPPYDSENAIAICHMHINKPIPELPKSVSGFQTLIDKTMAKIPADRVSSGDEIVQMLDDLAPLAAELANSIVGDEDKTLLRATTQGTASTSSITAKKNASLPIDDLTLQLVDNSTPAMNNSSSEAASGKPMPKQAAFASAQISGAKPVSKKSSKLPFFVFTLVVVVVAVVIKNIPLDTLGQSFEQTLDASEKIATESDFIEPLEEPSTLQLTQASDSIKRSTEKAFQSSEPVIPIVKFSKEKLEHAVEAEETETIIATLSTNPKPIKAETIKTKLLASLEIIAPKNQNLCGSQSPFVGGSNRVKAGQTLRAGDCFSIKIASLNKTDLIVYSHSEDGTIYRLIPNSCNAMGLRGTNIKASTSIQIPLNASQELTVIGLDDKAGTEWIYAVAVQDDAARQEVLESLSKVPDVCGDSGGTLAIDEVQQTLAGINRRMPKTMQWLATSFRHTAK